MIPVASEGRFGIGNVPPPGMRGGYGGGYSWTPAVNPVGAASGQQQLNFSGDNPPASQSPTFRVPGLTQRLDRFDMYPWDWLNRYANATVNRPPNYSPFITTQPPGFAQGGPTMDPTNWVYRPDVSAWVPRGIPVDPANDPGFNINDFGGYGGRWGGSEALSPNGGLQFGGFGSAFSPGAWGAGLFGTGTAGGQTPYKVWGH